MLQGLKHGNLQAFFLEFHEPVTYEQTSFKDEQSYKLPFFSLAK